MHQIEIDQSDHHEVHAINYVMMAGKVKYEEPSGKL